jgi:hypothetical protein
MITEIGVEGNSQEILPQQDVQKALRESTGKFLVWIEEYMLTFERGCWGVCERMIVSQKERVALSRPDTASEVLAAIYGHKKLTGDGRFDDVFENLINWLGYAQNTYFSQNRGSFPFSLPNGVRRPFKKAWPLYANDNAKILLNLLYLARETDDKRCAKMARPLADFWLRAQAEDGSFWVPGINRLVTDKGPCFVLWMMAALFSAADYFGDKRYSAAAQKAYGNFMTMVKDGRVLTSWEIGRVERWRPESSECFIALFALAHSYCLTNDKKLIDTALTIWQYCKNLIDDKTGAVKNGRPMENSTVDPDPSMCDLVYTEGFALHALISMYQATKDEEFMYRAKKLALWLASIQCDDDEPYFIRGGWRGSYSLDKGGYYGICDNQANEGGADSVYVGWASAVNVMGMFRLLELPC